MLKIISIEGNIGSGKSTVINSLKQLYTISNKIPKIYFLEEPVSEWETFKDCNGKNIIEKFYADQKKYSFSFQMMAYISRLSMLKNAIKECNKNEINFIICERSLQTDKNVFCKMLYDMGMIEDINYQIYLRWFDDFISDIPHINYIYIKADPFVSYERVIKRNRPGETIELGYLEQCNDYHDRWFEEPEYKDNTLVINGNQSSEKILDLIYKFINLFTF